MKFPQIFDFFSCPLRDNIVDWIKSNLMENRYINDFDFSDCEIKLEPLGHTCGLSISGLIYWNYKKDFCSHVKFMLMVNECGEILNSHCKIDHEQTEVLIKKMYQEFKSPIFPQCVFPENFLN